MSLVLLGSAPPLWRCSLSRYYFAALNPLTVANSTPLVAMSPGSRNSGDGVPRWLRTVGDDRDGQ